MFERLLGQFETQRAARIVTLRNAGHTDHARAKQVLDSEGVTGGEEATPPPSNPWLAPFKMLTALAIQPLRRRLVDPTQKFVRERMVRVTDPADPRFVYLHSFVAKYELFCLEMGLEMSGARPSHLGGGDREHMHAISPTREELRRRCDTTRAA